jgi:hypothetical protein
MNLQDLIDASINQFRGDTGEWVPINAGPREIISRSFKALLTSLFLHPDIKSVYPVLDQFKPFLLLVPEGRSIVIEGSSTNQSAPSILISGPEGTYSLSQLGVSSQVYDKLGGGSPAADKITKTRFVGSISLDIVGNNSLDAISLADVVSTALFSVLSSSLVSLSIHLTRQNIGKPVEKKTSNDVVAWRCPLVLNIDISDLSLLYTYDYPLFQRAVIISESK